MYQIKPNSVLSVKSSAAVDEVGNWYDKIYHNDKPGTLSSNVEIISIKKHGYSGDDKRWEKGTIHNIKAVIRLGDTTDPITDAIKRKLLGGKTVVSADNAGVSDVTITGGANTNRFDTDLFDLKLTYLNNENGNDVSYAGMNLWLKSAFDIKDGDNINEGWAVEFESSASFDFTAVDKVTTPTP